ncbi:MAG: glycogen synthase, partial [Bacilli bacterium]
DNIHYYFVENNTLFDRPNLYGYDDDALRFALFNKAVIGFMMQHNFYPDIIHLNDWPTGMIAPLLKRMYSWHEGLKNIKCMFTIHNLEYQGVFNLNVYEQLYSFFNDGITYYTMEAYGATNYIKAACYYSDYITTVSKTYAKEIQTPSYGFKLDGLMQALNYKLVGILNGIDTNIYNPISDPYIIKNYQLSNVIQGKATNKKHLQALYNLPQSAKTPLIGIVGRLTSQKGYDLVISIMEELIQEKVQIVILGVGDYDIEQLFNEMQYKYPKQVSVKMVFSEEIAMQIYAGSDLFLMPSRFEPCGIGQFLAMQYGSIPVVRATGGLKDSVIPYRINNKKSKGFDFVLYQPQDLLDAIKRALTLYKDKKEWQVLVKQAMDDDYSWQKSAQEYLKVYKKMVKK